MEGGASSQSDVDEEIDELVEKIEHEIVERPEVLERLMDKPAFVGLIQLQSSSFQGPLPPPKMLSDYEKILPGAAERIFQLTEREQASRHETQQIAINGAVGKDRRGQWMGFSITVIVLIIATAFALMGDKWFAGTLVTVDLIGLASVFVVGRLTQKNE